MLLLVPPLFILCLSGIGNPVGSSASAYIAVKFMTGKFKPYRDAKARTPLVSIIIINVLALKYLHNIGWSNLSSV